MPNDSNNDPTLVPASDQGLQIKFIDKPEHGPWEDYQLPQQEQGLQIKFIDELILPASASAGEDELILPAQPGPWEDYQTNKPNQATFGLGLRAMAQSGALGDTMKFLTRNTAEAKPARTAEGMGDAFVSGVQGSSIGLLQRGALPDVVLDPHHAPWYQKLAAGAGQMIGDLPAMIAGSATVGAASIPSGPGAVVAGGAAAFAVPTAIRQALTNAYSLEQVTSSGDFLSRVGIGVLHTGKDAVVGGLTAWTGGAVGKATQGWTKLGSGAATLSAEGTVMTVAPAALEGRLPEPEDFLNAAVLMLGMKAAHAGGARLVESMKPAAEQLRNTYAKTGITPEEVMAESHTNPTILEDLTKPTGEAPEVPRAFQERAARQAAEDAFPGTKAQQVLDNPFADIPEAKLPHQMNLRYIEGPQEVKALLTRMSEVYRSEIDTARGGTQTWAEIETKAAEQVAALTGQELEKVMAGRQVGDTANAIELKIRGDMLMQSTTEAATAIKRYSETLPGDLTDAMKMDALAAIHKSAMIQAELTGTGSEVARALGYLKQIKELRAQGEGMQKLVEKYGHDPELLLKMASTMDTPEKMATFARESTKATTEQRLLEAWKAGLVSGPFTQVANIMGNTTYMGLRPLVDVAAATVGIATRAPERVYATEALARVTGDMLGVMDGLKLAKAAFYLDEAGGKAGSRQAIPGTAGYVVRTPFRALAAMDQLFRTMNERGEAYALGTRQAIQEGFNPATREFRQRVAELALNPSEKAIEQIMAYGERATFNTPLGEKGQAINNAIVKAHLEFAVPFRSTPANIFKEMARHSPFAPVIGEWRAAIAEGGAAKQRALGEMAVGTGISALTMTLAKSGLITGAGDPDPNKRRVAAASGWQPYSIKVGDTWYSYQRFQPVGTLVGMAADMAEVWEHMTPDERDKVPKMLGTAFANSVTNQTFLQGIAQVTAAVAHPDRDLARFLNSLTSSTVPALLGQTAQMLDPYQREIYGVRDAIVNRIPLLRNQLEEKIDPWGEKIGRPERMGGVSPITTKDAGSDKVKLEAARLGIGVANDPKYITLPTGGLGGKLGRVELTPEQRRHMAEEGGKLAYEIMAPAVNSPGWAMIPDPIKAKMFRNAFADAHAYARVQALPVEQRAAEIRRITAELEDRLGQ